jgi:tRNA-specific 2-thiouridylase
VGRVDAVELVTIGQRKGLGLAGGAVPRYAVDVDVATATVTVGDAAALRAESVAVEGLGWAHEPVGGEVLVQVSAHGSPRPAIVDVDRDDPTRGVVRWREPQRRVAPGQSVVAYVGDEVVAGAIAARS